MKEDAGLKDPNPELLEVNFSFHVQVKEKILMYREIQISHHTWFKKCLN